ncbi:MAG: capsid protein, partial [Lachnospiraceae bacterium]|nr:capsid protein [Lachnospiraceae bacterium]
MGWLKNFIFKLLKIEPATERQIMIKEPLSFRATVLRNQIWYRGDPAEMEQFFKAVAVFDTDKARFW